MRLISDWPGGLARMADAPYTADMAKSFRVVDLRQDGPLVDTDIIVEGVQSPEAAVRDVLGIQVVRSGAKRDLVAKVYWQPIGQPLTMVRLYAKTEGE